MAALQTVSHALSGSLPRPAVVRGLSHPETEVPGLLDASDSFWCTSRRKRRACPPAAARQAGILSHEFGPVAGGFGSPSCVLRASSLPRQRSVSSGRRGPGVSQARAHRTSLPPVGGHGPGALAKTSAPYRRRRGSYGGAFCSCQEGRCARMGVRMAPGGVRCGGGTDQHCVTVDASLGRLRRPGWRPCGPSHFEGGGIRSASLRTGSSPLKVGVPGRTSRNANTRFFPLPTA